MNSKERCARGQQLTRKHLSLRKLGFFFPSVFSMLVSSLFLYLVVVNSNCESCQTSIRLDFVKQLIAVCECRHLVKINMFFATIIPDGNAIGSAGVVSARIGQTSRCKII